MRFGHVSGTPQAVGSAQPCRACLRATATLRKWVYGQALEPDEWSGGGLISLNELRRIHYMAMTPVWNIAPHPDATPEESPGSFRQHDIHPFSGGMTPPGSMRWFVRARQ